MRNFFYRQKNRDYLKRVIPCLLYTSFYKVNQEYSMNGTSVVSIIVGVVLLVACVALTLFMEKLGAPESTVSES